MTADHAQVTCPQELVRAPSGVLVRETVETEPTQPPAFAPRLRKGIGPGDLRHRRVEGSVEAGDGRHCGPCCPRSADARECAWLVQWRQRRETVDLVDHVVVDQGRLGELRATVDHTVADRVDAIEPPRKLSYRIRLAVPLLVHRLVEDPVVRA